MMGRQIADLAEPERGELREDGALIGNARAEHVVEGRDPIRRHDEKLLAKVVDVADFAATRQRQRRETGFEDNGHAAP
jgi:hypothetical protein